MVDAALARKREPNAEDVAIGGRLRALREQLGLPQQKVADLVGLTFQQIQKYEKGTNRLSISRAMQIAEQLGVNVRLLLPIGEAPASVTPTELVALEKKLAAGLKSVDAAIEALRGHRADLEQIKARIQAAKPDATAAEPFSEPILLESAA